MVKTVHVIGNDEDTVRMFAEQGWSCVIEDPDLVCFTGGADVSPELYLEGYQGAQSTDPIRDLTEVGWFLHYQRLGTPMAGICRGGQFLNVMCGGTMIQDHGLVTGIVTARDVDGRDHEVHVDHHQGIVRASSSFPLLDRYIGVHPVLRHGVGQTYACLYNDFWDSLVLCFQPHPEWGHEPTKELFFQYIKEYLCPYT